MNSEFHRRHFLGASGTCLGSLALASLLKAEQPAISADDSTCGPFGDGELSSVGHLVAKAKRVIYLFMHGGPSQLDLFDYKPDLRKRHGEELPESVRGNQRLTGMTSGQKSFPVTSSLFRFSQHGHSGAWVSELLPHTGRIMDECCLIRSMHTEAINHDPAIMLFQTGHQQPGRPSFGSASNLDV